MREESDSGIHTDDEDGPPKKKKKKEKVQKNSKKGVKSYPGRFVLLKPPTENEDTEEEATASYSDGIRIEDLAVTYKGSKK